jgi:hypothetical protein
VVSHSRLANQLAEVAGVLTGLGATYALIGGLALAAHKVIRGTQDVDLLVDLDNAQVIDAALSKLGYQCLHRNANAGNYLRGDERLDLLYASRTAAKRLLAAAQERHTGFGDLRVVSAEGLIGFKLQALVNNPRRTQDLEDIRALLRQNAGQLDMAEVRSYFQLFKREEMLNELLAEAD